jgi:2-keto-4-pentenoate hydratase/2-oxohepta-3-ene-1,7-dioic acid hydratase in catechol pathway
MRFLHYRTSSGDSQQGWVLNDLVGPVEGSIFGEFHRKDLEIPLESARLQSPIRPGKIVCVGRNYVDHAREHDTEVPEVPLLFLKPLQQSSVLTSLSYFLHNPTKSNTKLNWLW